MIRDAADGRMHADDVPDVSGIIEGSLMWNPFLSREPYRSECLPIARKAARNAKPEVKGTLDEAIWYMTLPDFQSAPIDGSPASSPSPVGAG